MPQREMRTGACQAFCPFRAEHGEAWDLVAGDHDSYVSEAKKVLERVKSVLESSGKELTGTARYYRETDRNETAELDATYPGSKVSDGGSGGDPQDFSDAGDVTDALKAPGGDSDNPLVKYGSGHVDEYNMNPVQKTLGSALDLGSPSAMAVEASKPLFGFAPFAEVTNWVFGDWNKCARAVRTSGPDGRATRRTPPSSASTSSARSSTRTRSPSRPCRPATRGRRSWHSSSPSSSSRSG
ncbi:hypothetical protein [Streptomyces sp. ISL-12]|uniref:hypothetical protein n=1 Tax=Streptomyces sp. ISL-12 TaxID=2819177 RepID=UPI00203652C0|nr:hypothetical protein [Streptomyces sp. ISL-12]